MDTKTEDEVEVLEEVKGEESVENVQVSKEVTDGVDMTPEEKLAVGGRSITDLLDAGVIPETGQLKLYWQFLFNLIHHLNRFHRP